MNRNEFLFDDISRVLASSIPRRQALRLVAGGIGGVIIGAIWPSRFAYAGESQCMHPCKPGPHHGGCGAGLDCIPIKKKGLQCCNIDFPNCRTDCCCEEQICCGEITCCPKATTMCCGKGSGGGTACCSKATGMCCANTCCDVCDLCDGGECLPQAKCARDENELKTQCCKNNHGSAACCDPACSPCMGGKCVDKCNKVTEECCTKGKGKDRTFVMCCPLGNGCTVEGKCKPRLKGTISGWHAGPPHQIQMTFQDITEGLAAVSIVKAVNVTVDIPSFVPGTTGRVLAIFTKMDQTQPSHFIVKGCSMGTDCTSVEPVATTLKLNAGRWASQRFGNLHEKEYFVTVQNGHVGLHELTVDMNGKRFDLRKLRDGERRDLNVSSAMVEGGHNVVILTGRGEVGASATIMISDTKVPTGPSAQIAAEIMGAHLGPGMERRRAHQNLVWGDLAEETEETSHLAFAESEGQTAQVVFGGRMDLNSVSDLTRYEVEVNGHPVRIEIVEPYVGSDNVTITLRLAGRELRSGDKVSVFWDGLLNDAGHLVSGHVGPLVVRTLQ